MAPSYSSTSGLRNAHTSGSGVRGRALVHGAEGGSDAGTEDAGIGDGPAVEQAVLECQGSPQVVLEVEPREVVLEVAGRPVGPQPESRALKGVVKGLGDSEKLVIGPDHLPVDRQPEGLEQRNLTRQDLRDPAARRRGVDVTDPYALKLAGELLQLGDQLVVCKGTVGRE